MNPKKYKATLVKPCPTCNKLKYVSYARPEDKTYTDETFCKGHKT